MATQQLTRSQLWSEDLAPVVGFLSQFGIAEREIHEYREDEIRKAIRARGWEVKLRSISDPPDWFLAEIPEWRALTQSQSAYGQDPDRVMALFGALRIALTWPSREEEAQAFDELARTRLGMSATTFLEKWRSDELDLSDSNVIDVLVARPLGW